MSLFVVVLLKERFIIKKQKEKRKTRDEKTREVKMDIKRRLRPILHQTLILLLSKLRRRSFTIKSIPCPYTNHCQSDVTSLLFN